MRNKTWSLLLAGAMVLSSQTAHAGFEWRSSSAPAAEQAVSADETPMPVPLAPVAAESIKSMITPAVAPDSAYEGVESFGRDIEVAIAMQQIVPADYQFSFAPEVDLKKTVSWQGNGEPWPAFLNRTLAPLGLKAFVRDHIVLVAPAGAALAETRPMQTVTARPAESSAPTPLAIRADVAPLPPAVKAETQIQTKEEKTLAEELASEKIAWESAPVVASAAQNSAPQNDAPLSLVPQHHPATPSATLPPLQEEKVVLAPVMPPHEPAAVVAVPVTGEKVEVISAQAPSWVAPQGALLRDVLKNWSAQAGVRLFWSIDYDYRLPRDVEMSGTYETAIQAVLDQFARTYPRPVAKLYTGSQERVLVVNSPDLLS